MSRSSCSSVMMALGGFVVGVVSALPGRALADSADADVIHGKTEEVLARPEFHPPEEPWLQKILRKIIEALFRWLGELHSSYPWLFWVFVVTCVGLLVFLIGLFVWKVGRMLQVGGQVAPDQLHHETRRRLSRGYWEEASRMAARAEFTEAIRFLFLSLVYYFDESGKVSFQKAYTNREYLALFEDRPKVHNELKVLVDTLDDHWYGQRPTDQQRYEHCLALYQRLR